MNTASGRRERVTGPVEGVPDDDLSGLTCQALAGAPLPAPSLGESVQTLLPGWADGTVEDWGGEWEVRAQTEFTFCYLPDGLFLPKQ